MVTSQCLRSKVKLVCVLKSLGRNVIMQVLFPAAVIVLVPVHWFLAGKSCILMRAKANWLFFTLQTMFYLPLSFSFFYFSPHPQFSYFPSSIFYSLLHNFTTFYYYRSSILISPLPPQFYYFPSSTSSFIL